MFYTTTLDTLDNISLANISYPGNFPNPNMIPTNYQINTPFRLVFVTRKIDNEESYTNECFISPEGTVYTKFDQEDFAYLNPFLKLHKHSFYEIMFVLEGEVFVNIENERHLYKKGSCCILNKNVMHLEEYITEFQVVFLQISNDLMNLLFSDLSLNFFGPKASLFKTDLGEFFYSNLKESNTSKDYLDFIPVKKDGSIAKLVHDCFDNITKETLSPKDMSSFIIKNLLIELFCLMGSPQNYSTTPIRIGSDSEYVLFQQLSEIVQHNNGRISRSQLSESLNYSGAYLNEICKKYSGLSLFDYGMTFTMKKAAELLVTTNENIESIESLLGFSNHTHFYKIFKNTYQMTPAAYRRKHFASH